MLYCLPQGFRVVDKELRNDVLVVINLLMGSDHEVVQSAQRNNSHASAAGSTTTAEGAAGPNTTSRSALSPEEQAKAEAACGVMFAYAAADAVLFDGVLAVATSPELGMTEHEGIVKHWALGTEELDLELKQLAWRVAVAGCLRTGASGPVAEAARSWGLMRVLLAYVEMVPGAAPPALSFAATAAARRWLPDQASALRAAALARLHALAPLAPEAYLAEDGPGVVLRLLGSCLAPGHVEAALRHLHRLVASAPEMAEVLGAAGGTRVLLDLLQDGSRPEGVRHFCLLLLAALCRLNGENLRRLRHESGVAVLLAQVRVWRGVCSGRLGGRAFGRDAQAAGTGVLLAQVYVRIGRVDNLLPLTSTSPRNTWPQLARCRGADPALPSPYTVAVLDALWACVVPDRKNAARFLVEDGLDALLELLEVGRCGRLVGWLVGFGDAGWGAWLRGSVDWRSGISWYPGMCISRSAGAQPPRAPRTHPA